MVARASQDRSEGRPSGEDEETPARVCPNCAYITREPIECCPRCETEMAIEREDNLADKASADSFPASDPPAH